MKEELEVSVQVHLVGTSVGVSEGGMIQQPNRELMITVKPSDIPENIDVDVSGLGIGDILTVADIRDKTKYTIINEDDFALAIVSAPRVEEEPEESVAAVEEKPAE
jgi:large subunit ribosomal protein L25